MPEAPKHRYLFDQILSDLDQKMVFLAGPRQVGKTTLSEAVLNHVKNGKYLNWDLPAHRSQILKQQLPHAGYIVLDEIHKYRSWRNFIKGYFDVYKKTLKILVTGSARLDHYRRGGDSLQGRYHMLHLHPLSVAELNLKTQSELAVLLEKSGFPEPYFSKQKSQSKRWSEEYRHRLIYDDVRDLERVADLAKLEQLMLYLPETVGSTLSVNSLREDLEVSHKAASHWLTILENVCYIYRLPPFAVKRLRALKKEHKAYLYDWSLCEKPSARFENMVASHLLKWVQYRYDVFGERYELKFYRDADQREVDFIILHNGKPKTAIECKWSDTAADSSLKYFKKKYPEVDAIQVCFEPVSEFYTPQNIRVVSALDYLQTLV